jgi:putative heme-binding domain-containing protein
MVLQESPGGRIMNTSRVAAVLALLLVSLPVAAEEQPRKVVLIAGPLDGGHPRGTHEYEKSVRLLAHCLDHASNLRGIRTEVHLGGWPDDPRTLDDADSIVLIASGSDRREQDHPFLVGDRLAVIERQMKRGCGLVLIHWCTFAPKEKLGNRLLEWVGGYFDYESGPPPRGWYSKIQTATTTARPGSPSHPICSGMKSFQLREEYYYHLRFRERDPRLVPVLTTPIPGERDDQVVAWAVERTGGGRGFGFTGGHFFDNWKTDNFRRMVLNAIAWTTHAEVPEGGVRSDAPTEEELEQVPVGRPIRAVIVTGHQYPGHLWRETTKALQEALGVDRRVRLRVVEDVEFLARPELLDFDVVVFNYCNWERAGLSEAAKKNFVRYLSEGGGLVLVHFANGAFHFSLPKAGAGDWPEWRTRICRRVWDHTPGKSGHDAYGPFRVEIAKTDHPITRGLEGFETKDELYYRQQGDEPVVVLATARSKATGRDEPMAMVHEYGKGRVFQTVLGHDAASLRVPGVAQLIRRGTAWAAGRPPLAVAAAVPPAASPLVPGRFGQALDARRAPAEAAYRAVYQQPPLTIECWAKLEGAGSYNLLVVSNTKDSSTHWEIFTMPGSGHFTAYLPGRKADHVHSEAKVCDGKWHHLAMVYEAERVRLYVDARMVADQRVAAGGGTAREGPLWLGAYLPPQLGCDGLIDEVHLRRGAHPPTAIPDTPPAAGEDTLALWHLDTAEGGKTPDASRNNNAAVVGPAIRPAPPAPAGPSSRTELDYHPADPRLKAVLVDRSPDESYVAIKVDTQGRLFVGGREALFVFEPEADGKYKRHLLYRFPPDSWVAGIETRGNDLYVLTAAALYLIPDGRTQRTDLRPRRLLWGVPLDLHVSFHCLAWGPEGDLYLNHGDPLLRYGDFSRPDHWGHWTLYPRPEGTKVPYTGSGAVLRMRPDGSDVRVVARGLRGPFGLAFDRNWELFTNDNDHESMPHLYTPARLLHVTPHTEFFWPRGWVATRSPERSDLLETMLETPGRGVPVGMAYHDDPFLPSEYRHNLLQARWDRLTITRHPLEQRSASYRTNDLPFLTGRVHARPVGVASGRGGRVFAAISYMAGNEASPHYVSDLMMITRADDPPGAPFEPFDITTATPKKLWDELSHPAWSRRLEAHTELLRRGGALLDEAIRRLGSVHDDDPVLRHLPWLAAASRTKEATAALTSLASHKDAEVRLQAVRALAAFPPARSMVEVFRKALRDSDPRVQLAAIGAFFDLSDPLPLEDIAALAASKDSYLRQTAAMLLARRSSLAQLQELASSTEPARRLAVVLSAGFRLTVPPADHVPPRELPLGYPAENAFFKVKMRFADGEADLRSLGRGGSFSIAEEWKAVRPTAEQAALFDLLVSRLKDSTDPVRAQAAYFLSLLRDPRSEPAVAETMRKLREETVARLPLRAVRRAWAVGPLLADTPASASPEAEAIDLEATYRAPKGTISWQVAGGEDGLCVTTPARPEDHLTAYFYFQLHAASKQVVQLVTEGSTVKVWHNGKLVREERASDHTTTLLDIQPGSNDILIRAQVGAQLVVKYRARDEVTAVLPEKLGFASLARRLREAGRGAQTVPAEFLSVDWQSQARKGNRDQGRKLFGALGCVKCHAITADQAGAGAPSLVEAGKRFTVPYLVESILLPSNQVAEPFRASMITTRKGVTLTGLVVSETADGIELLLPDTTRTAIAKKDIEERQLTKTSPMPAGLVKTPDELRDLLAYLLGDNPLPP